MNKEELLKEICKNIGYSPSDFIVTRLEDAKADLYSPNYSQRGLGGIIIGDDGRHLTCGSQYSMSKYIEDFKNGLDDYTISPEIFEKTFEKDSEGRFIRLNIPVDYLKKLGFDVSEDLNLIGKREEDLTKEEHNMFETSKKSLENRINKSLKLSNGKYAENEETKEAFEKYMEEVKAFNEKVERGEDPGITQGDLLAKYKQQFYDQSLEEKKKKLEEEFNNREIDTRIDDLISSIDKKLDTSSTDKSIDEQIEEIDKRISELDNNISFEKAKKIADEKAKEWNKVIVGISENDEYWLFNADNDSHPMDDGAGSCYISKKDGSIRPLNRWDMEFTKKFDETAKNLLVRTSLSELYGYHSKNNINDEKSALEYIDNISKAFSKYSFKSDNNFILLGRKKIIYDEINDILKGNKEVDNPIYFVLGSLEEFICNNNFVYMSDGDQWEKGWEDLRNRNDIYSAMNVICLEEKNIIDSIISEIRNYITKRTTL